MLNYGNVFEYRVLIFSFNFLLVQYDLLVITQVRFIWISSKHLLSNNLQASQHQKSLYGFGSSNSSYERGYSHGGLYHHVGNFAGPTPSLGMNNRNSIAVDKGRRRGKGSALVCSCNGPLDFLNEQSRGPRATRPKKQAAEQDSLPENKRDKPITGVNKELYNSPDFPSEYTNARFFIIKSYSEDNVHKSIKYGVWASTANGNKKLDSAFREAKEREDPYPIFLFFSVILRPFVSPLQFHRRKLYCCEICIHTTIQLSYNYLSGIEFSYMPFES